MSQTSNLLQVLKKAAAGTGKNVRGCRAVARLE